MSSRADFTWAYLDLPAAVFGTKGLGESIDSMASRYAAMKNCIESEDTGDEKASSLKQLDQLMEHYTDSLAQRFAEEVGGTFEKNGAAGVSDRLYQSILSEVTQRTAQSREQRGYYSSAGHTGKRGLYAKGHGGHADFCSGAMKSCGLMEKYRTAWQRSTSRKF